MIYCRFSGKSFSRVLAYQLFQFLNYVLAAEKMRPFFTTTTAIISPERISGLNMSKTKYLHTFYKIAHHSKVLLRLLKDYFIDGLSSNN